MIGFVLLPFFACFLISSCDPDYALTIFKCFFYVHLGADYMRRVTCYMLCIMCYMLFRALLIGAFQ